MIDDTARPRLASKARLRLDKQTGKQVLLYPEKGLVLNATAARIVSLCTGERTVSEIVDQLRSEYADQPGLDVAANARTFLQSLADRGLLQGFNS